MAEFGWLWARCGPGVGQVCSSVCWDLRARREEEGSSSGAFLDFSPPLDGI